MPFSPIKDGRRILGEKDTNTCLSPAHQNKQSLSVAGTPTKRTLFTNISPKKLLPSPIFAGQKRTRDQVEEVEVNTGRGQDSSSQSTIKRSIHEPEQVPNVVDSTPTSDSKRDETAEDQMETQRSQNASQSLEQETRSIPEDTDARKMFIQEKAILLRNTLQTAMRNVTSHHFDRRVSELEAHSRKCPRISLSSLSTPSTSFRKVTTPSQFRTPRVGTTHMSSTPFQSTPDLPAHPSTLDDSSCVKKSQRTPPRTFGSPMQLSSPPATVIRDRRAREVSEEPRRQDESEKQTDLSPSQRGDAVDGLLKLMSTTGSHDSSDAWTG